MLNANKLALQAARKVILEYRTQNKRLFEEYKEAYTSIKLAVNDGFDLCYRFNNNDASLTLYFIDANETEIELVFREYQEIRVANAFASAYFYAKNLNTLCF